MILTKTAFTLKGNLFRTVFFPTELFSSTTPDPSELFAHCPEGPHPPVPYPYCRMNLSRDPVKEADSCSTPDLLNQSLWGGVLDSTFETSAQVILKYPKICFKH